MISKNWQAIFKKAPLSMLLLGVSAGLPYMLIFSTLSLWLQQAGIDRSAITYFSWAALGYAFKFIWAPLVDTLPLPIIGRLLGRRRSWLLFTQVLLILSIAAMAFCDPAQHLYFMAALAVLLGFSAASQDLAIDAYRIECAPIEMQALLSSVYVIGYRVGMVATGAGALLLASFFGADEHGYHYHAWRSTYLWMALLPLVGLVTTLWVSEPVNQSQKTPLSPAQSARLLGLFLLAAVGFGGSFYYLGDVFAAAQQSLLAQSPMGSGTANALALLFAALRIALALLAAWLVARVALLLGVAPKELARAAYIAPVADFFARYGTKVALLILAFIGLYRISDIVMGAVANIFYQDMGFSLLQIGAASKTYGLLMIMVGSLLGGLLALRFGLIKVLFLGALLSSITNLLFAYLAQNNPSAPQLWQLYVVISADNLAAGIAQAAFIAFLSALTNIQFTAAQYAIFSSLMTFLPKILAGYSGALSTRLGYHDFFIVTALLGLPVLLLIWLLVKRVAIQLNPNQGAKNEL